MTIRVLIVDDHEGWRRHVASAVRQNLQCQLIGEAADGLEALHKAESLKPDLIVLDIGLPGLNGIAAARRIRTTLPGAKILFVSEHQSPDIAEAALQTGADGYVVKSNAGAELSPAIEAIVQGQRFISARLAGPIERISRAMVPRPTRHHEVQFCPDDASLLDGFARFVAAALQVGGAAIVVAASSHQQPLLDRLQGRGLDVNLAIVEGRYLWVDVGVFLAAIMHDDWPDEARFWAATTPLVAAARASSCTPARVVACGAVAPTLWRAGHHAAAIRFERLCDDLARAYDVDVLCGYPATAPGGVADEEMFQRVSAEHSAIHTR